MWYLFASRNHRVYPICREEAVRLLRSTRMARAYSEGAYTSDFDYERYWRALPLHPCIRHLVVSSSCPLSVFNFSVIVLVMTENDILSDIGLLWTSHHGSEVVGVKYESHNSLCVLRLRAMCVADGQNLTVSSLMSLFMYPCIPTVVCGPVLCVIISVVVLFFMCSCLLLTYTMTSLMHCSGLHSSFVNYVWAVGPFHSCIERPANTEWQSPTAPIRRRNWHGPLLWRNAVNDSPSLSPQSSTSCHLAFSQE